MTEGIRWVEESTIVNANYAAGGGTHATGKVIAYFHRPTVLIETADGLRVSWLAELCTPTGEPE